MLTVRRERKGRQVDDDIRPAIRALSVTSPDGHLRAELATHPRGVRPGDLVTALGTGAVPGRACRTHQWIEREGARFEPLTVSRPGTDAVATTQHARRATPHVRDGNQPEPGGSPPGAAGGQQHPTPLRGREQRQARKPKIGDTRPAPPVVPPPAKSAAAPRAKAAAPVVPLTRPGGPARQGEQLGYDRDRCRPTATGEPKRPRNRRRSGRDGRERRSKQVGRYLVCVHVQPRMTQIAMLEGRSLMEHYISRASDDTNQIDGNIYLGRVQNVLPGMEAAFVESVSLRMPSCTGVTCATTRTTSRGAPRPPRIEEVLKAGQTIVCQVTKNPIGTKGARLTRRYPCPGASRCWCPNSHLRHLQAAGRQRTQPLAPHPR